MLIMSTSHLPSIRLRLIFAIVALGGACTTSSAGDVGSATGGAGTGGAGPGTQGTGGVIGTGGAPTTATLAASWDVFSSVRIWSAVTRSPLCSEIQASSSPLDVDFWSWAMERYEGAAEGFHPWRAESGAVCRRS